MSDGRVSLFLTRTDLAELTGSKRRDVQRQWLADRGYRFETRGDGTPVVMVEEVRGRLVGGKNRRVSGPDLSALDRCG